MLVECAAFYPCKTDEIIGAELTISNYAHNNIIPCSAVSRHCCYTLFSTVKDGIEEVEIKMRILKFSLHLKNMINSHRNSIYHSSYNIKIAIYSFAGEQSKPASFHYAR